MIAPFWSSSLGGFHESCTVIGSMALAAVISGEPTGTAKWSRSIEGNRSTETIIIQKENCKMYHYLDNCYFTGLV